MKNPLSEASRFSVYEFKAVRALKYAFDAGENDHIGRTKKGKLYLSVCGKRFPLERCAMFQTIPAGESITLDKILQSCAPKKMYNKATDWDDAETQAAIETLLGM